MVLILLFETSENPHKMHMYFLHTTFAYLFTTQN